MLAPEEVPALKWSPADEEGLVAFLVGEKSFSEDRVRKTVEKLNAQRGRATQGGHLPHMQAPCKQSLLCSEVTSWAIGCPCKL